MLYDGITVEIVKRKSTALPTEIKFSMCTLLSKQNLRLHIQLCMFLAQLYKLYSYIAKMIYPIPGNLPKWNKISIGVACIHLLMAAQVTIAKIPVESTQTLSSQQLDKGNLLHKDYGLLLNFEFFSLWGTLWTAYWKC